MIPGAASAMAVLSAMITPAVLISACGTLILSTSMRLARVVDRVRDLSTLIESLYRQEAADALTSVRRDETEKQLEVQTRRGRLIQRALTSFYVALAVFVGTTIGLALSAFVPAATWAPTALGIFGTLALFYGCVLLIRETRLALLSVDMEMEFVLALRRHYQERGAQAAPGTARSPTTNGTQRAQR